MKTQILTVEILFKHKNTQISNIRMTIYAIAMKQDIQSYNSQTLLMSIMNKISEVFLLFYVPSVDIHNNNKKQCKLLIKSTDIHFIQFSKFGASVTE